MTYCTRIRRRSLWVPLTALAAFVIQGPLAGQRDAGFEYMIPAGPGNSRNSEATILKKLDGSLWMAWSDFYTDNSSDWAPSRVSVLISNDGGRTWGSRFVLQENIATVNVMSPEFVRLKSGKLLFAFWANHAPNHAEVMTRLSSDDGKTWTSPKRIPADPSPAYWMNLHNTMIQLRTGRIISPLYYTTDYRVDKYVRIRPYYSDNEGGSWKASRTLIEVPESKRGAEEPTVVELKNGSVLMFIRTEEGHVYSSVSSNGGETWEKPARTALVSPRSPVKIVRIPTTGDLLVIWNNSSNKRCPLTSAISRDEGKTWDHFKNIETDESRTYAYTGVTFNQDMALLTYYVASARLGAPTEQLSDKLISLKLRALPISWFY